MFPRHSEREVSNIATGFLWIKYIYYIVCVSCMITILKTDNPNTSKNGKMLGEIKYFVYVSYFLFSFVSTREQISSSLQHNPPEVCPHTSQSVFSSFRGCLRRIRKVQGLLVRLDHHLWLMLFTTLLYHHLFSQQFGHAVVILSFLLKERDNFFSLKKLTFYCFYHKASFINV